MKSLKCLSKKSILNTLILFTAVFNIQSFAATKSIVVAGGCFWCMEGPFDHLAGVLKTTSGYAGGKLKDPSYHDVSSGESGHLEVVEVQYDDSKISLEQILETFYKNINPTDAGGQFVDRGPQYATAIFYNDSAEEDVAKKITEKMQKFFTKKIVTRIIKLDKFYAAEDYHQDYYLKNPIRYKFYRYNSGRDQYLKNQWK